MLPVMMCGGTPPASAESAEPWGESVTWDPANKGAGISLAAGNLTISGASGGYGVRSTISHNTGRHVFEFTVNASGAIGICTPSQSMSVYFNDAASAGAFTVYSGTGNKYNYPTLAVAYMAVAGAGAVLGVLLDSDAGTVTIYRNGVSQGVMFSGLSGAYYAYWGCPGSQSYPGGTANFGGTPFAYTY